ncbi:hypothetical protein ACFFGR_14380 [Arthrobacter liuii]|uniref:Uncharacterized protein n=1 Tax=Arthrobacter liuii TaxID=1476996 RepID=A0ABQ2AZI2_9MICC|nr:hypothetical protein [Arthrobacter liuii]GGI03222.1 hypothetical protein GCM10007170_46700 [Arthrobacter liuii]
MDRTTLNIAPALRLLLVGGLFAMCWIIFGAGSAHASPAPPPGESPHTADGLVTSLTAPVKPLITAVQPRTEPGPQRTTTPSTVQGPAKAAQPVGGTAPAAAPVRQPSAPVAQFVAGTAQPLLAPVTDLADAVVAPGTAPVAQPVAGTAQPLLAPVTGLAGSVLSPVDAVTRPVTGLITGTTTAAVTGPISGIPSGAPPATATTAVAPVTANTSLRGADPSATVHSPLPTGIADVIAPRGGASMDEGGASPQSPIRLPGGLVPATALVYSPVSGSAGASGPTGAGGQAAADLSYRFILPMTQGGDGSLFSFVLPGPTTQDPGFSPD